MFVTFLSQLNRYTKSITQWETTSNRFVLNACIMTTMEFEKKWMSNEQEMSGFIQERNKRTPLFFYNCWLKVVNTCLTQKPFLKSIFNETCYELKWFVLEISTLLKFWLKKFFLLFYYHLCLCFSKYWTCFVAFLLILKQKNWKRFRKRSLVFVYVMTTRTPNWQWIHLWHTICLHFGKDLTILPTA